VSDRDSKRIVRQWNREIEDELRRESEAAAGERRWSGVVWAALWLLWLGLLLLLIVSVKALR